MWLAPESNWRERYAGWPVRRKLEYVDTLMREIADQRPAVVSRARVDPLSRLRKTLRQHYEEKRRHYGLDEDVSDVEEQAKLDFGIALTVQTMNHLHSGRHRIVR